MSSSLPSTREHSAVGDDVLVPNNGVKRICVVTGTRAEYGLLRTFMQEITQHEALDLSLVVTGSHLANSTGATIDEVNQDAFPVVAKIPILSDAHGELDVAKATGKAISNLAASFQQIQPDLIVLLGDRFETFAAAVAATLIRIPIAHFHGGETTEGAFDESFRHAITKMSHFHFTATERYRKRVIQLGEHPDSVFHIGALGIDAIENCNYLSRGELEKELEIQWQTQNLLVTFHPVTLEKTSAEKQISNLLKALEQLPNLGLIFTMPNADPESEPIRQKIIDFCRVHSHRAWCFDSLGQQKYFSALNVVDAVVGNSSSGLIEAPSFGIPTVNIGNRQKGRDCGTSVIHCEAEFDSIVDAIRKALDEEMRQQAANTKNIYGEPGAAKKSVEILRKASLDGILKKAFFDVEFQARLPHE